MHDLEKTRLQETGQLKVNKLNLTEVLEIISDLGIRPSEVEIVGVIDANVEKFKPCEAVIWHGPGHQSKTRCQEKGPHDIHSAVYGSMRQLAEWRGEEVHSGFFDEPPRDPAEG